MLLAALISKNRLFQWIKCNKFKQGLNFFVCQLRYYEFLPLFQAKITHCIFILKVSKHLYPWIQNAFTDHFSDSLLSLVSIAFLPLPESNKGLVHREEEGCNGSVWESILRKTRCVFTWVYTSSNFSFLSLSLFQFLSALGNFSCEIKLGEAKEVDECLKALVLLELGSMCPQAMESIQCYSSPPLLPLPR